MPATLAPSPLLHPHERPPLQLPLPLALPLPALPKQGAGPSAFKKGHRRGIATGNSGRDFLSLDADLWRLVLRDTSSKLPHTHAASHSTPAPTPDSTPGSEPATLSWSFPPTSTFPFHKTRTFPTALTTRYSPLPSTNPSAVYPLQSLGSGSHGHVLAAVRKADTVAVAVKLVPKHSVSPSGWIRTGTGKKLLLEVVVMKKLCEEKCEGVIKILEVIEDDVCVYIVMERLGGCLESTEREGVLKTMDLFTYIDTHAPTPSATLSIFLSVARTLRQLHTLGIVHRDIKDENILISTCTNPKTGREEVSDVRLIDFGSCGIEGVQSVGKGGRDAKGREWFDEYEGTLQYAPPEVLLGKVFNGRKADVWSLGILLFTLLHGVPPFSTPQQTLDGPLPPLRVPLCPPSAAHLIRWMLEKRPDKRPSCEEILNHWWCTSGRQFLNTRA